MRFRYVEMDAAWDDAIVDDHIIDTPDTRLGAAQQVYEILDMKRVDFDMKVTLQVFGHGQRRPVPLRNGVP